MATGFSECKLVWEVDREISSLVMDEKKEIIYVGRFHKELPIQMFTFAGEPVGYIYGQPSFWAPRLALDTLRSYLLAVPSTTIRVFNSKRKQMSIRCPEFQQLDDVAYEPRKDKYIVADKKARCIFIIDPKTRTVIKSVPSPDEEEMLLENNQVCVATDKFRNVRGFVTTDAYSAAVRLYDDDGQPLKVYKSEGGKHGQFNCPMGVCISPDGSIIISDSFNDRLVRLRPEERAHGQWSVLMDTTEHKLANPRTIDITSRGLIAVATWSSAEGPYKIATFLLAANQHTG